MICEITDYSKGNRIKYEVWEIVPLTGDKSLVVAFHPNVNVNQTIQNLYDFLNSNNSYKSLSILILSQSLVKDLSLIKNNNFNIKNIKYDSYIWDFCVSSDVKNFPIPSVIEFYTIQELEDENKNNYYNAVTYLSKMDENKKNGNSVNLIIGSGGIGKTSLCHSIANKLKTLYKDFLIIYISSEDIRKFISQSSIYGGVNSLYDLYQMESKYLNNDNIFDENTFNACILSGKIITIIDGLDELDSIFNEGFNLIEFLKKISEFNSELGDSYFIMTSREYVGFSDDLFNELNINKLNLLGFSLNSCENYLTQRFFKYPNSDDIVSAVSSKIDTSLLLDEQRVVPFFVDVISTMYEDAISNGDSDGFELVEELTPYPSLNKLNDHLIFSIFRREKTRHDLKESIESMVRTFVDLCSDLHDSWRLDDFQEIIEISYDRNVDEYISQVKKNPLLNVGVDRIYLKYSFLKFYFVTLDLYSFFLKGHVDTTFVRLINRINNDSKEINDISSFLINVENYIDSLKHMVKALTSLVSGNAEHYASKKENENIKAIEKIIYILNIIHKSSPSKFSESIRYIYDADSGEISKLFVNGDVHSFNFSNLKVNFSQFRNYNKFLNSNFEGADFSFCKFISCHNTSIKNSTITMASFDKNNCEMNDLSTSIDVFNNKSKINNDKVRDDLKSFFSSFYRAGNFRDLKLDHFCFSGYVDKLREGEFNKILKKGFIVLSADKAIGKFYEVNKSYKASVRKFIMDGMEDSNIKEIIQWLKE